MHSKRELKALLYGRRAKAGLCVVCEAPAHPYIYCADCRADRAQGMRERRGYRTQLTEGLFSPHPST